MDAAGQVQYVLATEYPSLLRGDVRLGSHAFIGEDLTAKVLMAQQFSETGKAWLYLHYNDAKNLFFVSIVADTAPPTFNKCT